MTPNSVPQSESSLESRIGPLPHARMVYPDNLGDRLKYAFWRVYTPYHPIVRDTFVSLGVVRHEGRQDYLLGKLAEGRSVEEFVLHLITSHGFGNHFVAWRDEGEVVSLRYVENFEYQYHLRIFADGEIRGHYEYTPECYPIKHIREVGQEDRRDFFLEKLGDWLE